jgi:hypothetical protein
LDYSLEKWLKLFLGMAWRIWIIWIIILDQALAIWDPDL